MKTKKIVLCFLFFPALFLNAQIYTPSGTIQGSSNNNNIGIGISSPEEALEIYGSAKNLLITNTAENESGIIFKDEQDIFGMQKAKILFNSNTTNDNRLNFYIANMTNPKMTIRCNGNVGISTTTPEEKLHINGGKFKITDDYGLFEITTTDNIGEFQYLTSMRIHNDFLQIFRGDDYTSYAGLVVKSVEFSFEKGLSSNLWIDSDIIHFSDNGESKIELKKDGTAKFSGKVTAQEIEVKQDVWSDYVFNEDYNLLTIEEVDNYIKENKHLPEIPSESEVIENGLNLGQMDALLLKKVEELTLYLIDLKRENEKLVTRIELLEK